MIRIGNGQAYWGDWSEAALGLIEQGPLDYLTLNYLSELAMATLEHERQRDPALGYVTDFPPLIGRLAGRLRNRNVRVIANAGALNPLACSHQLRSLAPELKVAVVLGDDVTGRIGEFLDKGYPLANTDSGRPLSEIQDRILNAGVHLGAFPLADALATGADVVVTGRCAGAVLACAPAVCRFGWRHEQWDKLAAGMVAGHIARSGARVAGGNSQAAWPCLPDPDELGYPIIEMQPDGAFDVTKHPGTGGRIDSLTVLEQLLCGVGDPRCYYTPDCVVDFTSLRLEETAPDRVRVRGAKGSPPSQYLKLSIHYSAGWKATGALVYSWPDAVEKAQAAARILRRRLDRLGLRWQEIRTEYLGVNACLGSSAPPVREPPEVQLRIAVRSLERDAAERFAREFTALLGGGPPGAIGDAEGPPRVSEIVGCWPALIPRSEIRPQVEVLP